MGNLSELLQVPGAGIEVDDDLDAIYELCIERGWSDGLPIVPPTARRVEEMLAYCDRAWDEPLAALAPRYGAATPLRLAANAVMAGCRPEYFPLVMLAIEAMVEEPFNLYGIQATTHPCAPFIIVNGPVAKELGMASAHGALGPGGRANATIGRAVRLALVNIGGAIPALGDMATQGSPAKYTYCAAENEAASPWEPLHVERGFPADATTVTVVAAEGPHNINDHESLGAEGILKTFSGSIAATGSNDVYHRGTPVIAFGPEHAATVAAGGFSKAAVKQHVFDHARLPMSRFSDENIARRFRSKMDGLYDHAPLDTLVPMVRKADDFIVIVLGGAGKHSAYMPTFGTTRAVTRALKHRDGRLVASVAGLRNR
jgi:hypothetical protein